MLRTHQPKQLEPPDEKENTAVVWLKKAFKNLLVLALEKSNAVHTGYQRFWKAILIFTATRTGRIKQPSCSVLVYQAVSKNCDMARGLLRSGMGRSVFVALFEGNQIQGSGKSWSAPINLYHAQSFRKTEALAFKTVWNWFLRRPTRCKNATRLTCCLLSRSKVRKRLRWTMRF